MNQTANNKHLVILESDSLQNIIMDRVVVSYVRWNELSFYETRVIFVAPFACKERLLLRCASALAHTFDSSGAKSVSNIMYENHAK